MSRAYGPLIGLLPVDGSSVCMHNYKKVIRQMCMSLSDLTTATPGIKLKEIWKVMELWSSKMATLMRYMVHTNYVILLKYHNLFLEHMQGDFHQGVMYGQGRYVWKDGLVYEGEFHDCKITGVGKYTWPNGR